MEHYKRSLELLSQFLKETSSDDLASLIGKHQESDINGPTFSEYLAGMQEVYENVIWNNTCSDPVQVMPFSDIELYILEAGISYYAPPPIIEKIESVNKDSVIFTESFFLV